MLTKQKLESTGKLMYIENLIFNNENCIFLSPIFVILNGDEGLKQALSKDEG